MRNRDALLQMIPLYQKVRGELEREFSRLPVGSKLPTEYEIMAKFGISRVTARMALKSLRKRGIIKSFSRKGSFLAKRIMSPSVFGKSNLIGVVVPTAQGQLAETIRAIEATISKKKYHMVLAHDNDDPKLHVGQIRKILDANISGLIIYPDREATDTPEFIETLRMVREKGLPIVLLDRYLPSLDLPCVFTDNIRGMYSAVEHLICTGHRRPALIGFWENNTVHQDRRKGAIDALNDAGIAAPVLEALTGPNPLDVAGYEIVLKWIRNSKDGVLPFDSIICMNDRIAYGAYTALRASGYRVPEQVALVGYDNKDSAYFRAQGLNLTSVEQPMALMGQKAAEMLIALVRGKAIPQGRTHCLLQPKLVVRASSLGVGRQGQGVSSAETPPSEPPPAAASVRGAGA